MKNVPTPFDNLLIKNMYNDVQRVRVANFEILQLLTLNLLANRTSNSRKSPILLNVFASIRSLRGIFLEIHLKNFPSV